MGDASPPSAVVDRDAARNSRTRALAMTPHRFVNVGPPASGHPGSLAHCRRTALRCRPFRNRARRLTRSNTRCGSCRRVRPCSAERQQNAAAGAAFERQHVAFAHVIAHRVLRVDAMDADAEIAVAGVDRTLSPVWSASSCISGIMMSPSRMLRWYSAPSMSGAGPILTNRHRAVEGTVPDQRLRNPQDGALVEPRPLGELCEGERLVGRLEHGKNLQRTVHCRDAAFLFRRTRPAPVRLAPVRRLCSAPRVLLPSPGGRAFARRSCRRLSFVRLHRVSNRLPPRARARNASSIAFLPAPRLRTRGSACSVVQNKIVGLPTGCQGQARPGSGED